MNGARSGSKSCPSIVERHLSVLGGMAVWSLLAILQRAPRRAAGYPPYPPCIPGDEVWTDTKCYGVVLRCTDKCGVNNHLGADVVHWSRSYTCGACFGLPW